MSEFRYKAFISYSHADSAVAEKLHGVLESYRVPKRLRGYPGAYGPVPEGVRPIFRDREELTASHSLNKEIEDALAASESLIVICSPAAHRSHWINEEIRLFRALGRGDRIYCLIIDGDPQARSAPEACFPDALLEGIEDGRQEPLAADLRPWADGKRLAKHKLLAGMLGIPLDELRRREHQRAVRRRLVLGALALVVALAAAFSFNSWQAAEQRKSSGQTLVAMKLNELRVLLDVEQDPNQLARLAEWAEPERSRLWAQATADGADPMAYSLAERDAGIAAWEQGRLDEAMAHFRDAWAVNALVFSADPEDLDAYFELGQAEFWLGQAHWDFGDAAPAEEAFVAYAEITRRLLLAEPEKAEWVLEMAYALTNLGILPLASDGDRPERALQLMQSALEYNQLALVLDPGNRLYSAELGESFVNLATAQFNVCDLEGALETTEESVNHELASFESQSKSYDHQMNLSAALGTRSALRRLTGDSEGALDDLQRSLDMVEAVRQERPEEVELMALSFERQSRIARLEGEMGRAEAGLRRANAVLEPWEALIESDRAPGIRWHTDLAWLYITLAGLYEFTGNDAETLANARRGMALSKSLFEQYSDSRAARQAFVASAFLAWETTGTLPIEVLDDILLTPGSHMSLRSCSDAETGLRTALMLGEQAEAERYAAYLKSNGWKAPSFLRICSVYSVCTQ